MSNRRKIKTTTEPTPNEWLKAAYGNVPYEMFGFMSIVAQKMEEENKSNFTDEDLARWFDYE